MHSCGSSTFEQVMNICSDATLVPLAVNKKNDSQFILRNYVYCNPTGPKNIKFMYHLLLNMLIRQTLASQISQLWPSHFRFQIPGHHESAPRLLVNRASGHHYSSRHRTPSVDSMMSSESQGRVYYLCLQPSQTAFSTEVEKAAHMTIA